MNRLFYILCTICMFYTYSQEELNSYMEKLNVQKKYNFEIIKKDKIIYQPVFVDTSKVEKIQIQFLKSDSFDFSLEQKSYLTNPPKIKREYLSIKNNNISFGYGNQDAFYLDYSYNKLFDFKRSVFFELNNESKDFNILNNFVKNSESNSHKFLSIDGFSNSSFSTLISQLNSNSEINSGFDFYSQNGLYFGGMTDEDLDSLSPYSGLGFGVNLNLNRLNEKAFFKDLSFSYKNHSARHVRFQNLYTLTTNFSYDLGLMNFNSNFNLSLIKNKFLINPSIISPTSFQENSSTYFGYFNKNTIFYSFVKSKFSYSNQIFGLSYNWIHNNGLSEFYLLPFLRLYYNEYNISFEYKSKILPHYFSEISKIIPYLTPSFMDHFSKKEIYKLSFSKNINSKFSINTNVIYSYERDNLVPFLITDNINLGSPVAMYFDNLNKLKLNFNLSYNEANIETFFNVIFTEMSSDYYNNINYEPAFSFDYFFQVEPIENLLLSLDILYYSKRDAINPSTTSLDDIEVNSLNNFFVLNFDINYLLNESFKVNFGLKNLMDFKYEYFDGYTEERGRRFFTKLSFSF